MQIDPLDPHRPPDWRWQFARQSDALVFSAEDVRRRRQYLRSDPYLSLARKAHEYQEKLDRQLCNSFLRGRPTKNLTTPNRDIRLVQYGAQYASKNQDSLFWLGKAMLLGRTPLSMVTSMLGRSQEFLSLITPIFFDVESRLDDEVFILHHVIGTAPRQGLRDAEALWQECAYFGGYQRMLHLGAKGYRQNLQGLYRAVREKTPALEEYLDPGKVSRDVIYAVKSRKEPDPQRTIKDLRQLYQSIGGTAAAAQNQEHHAGFVAQTYFETVDDRTGQRQRLPAEVLQATQTQQLR